MVLIYNQKMLADLIAFFGYVIIKIQIFQVVVRDSQVFMSSNFNNWTFH